MDQHFSVGKPGELPLLLPCSRHMSRDPFVRQQRLDRVVLIGEQLLARDEFVHRVVAEATERDQACPHLLDQVRRRRTHRTLAEGTSRMRRGDAEHERRVLVRVGNEWTEGLLYP